MAPQQTLDEELVTVRSYKPGQYSKAEWEVLDDNHEGAKFVPAAFEAVEGATFQVDSMFADFGAPAQDCIELSKDAGDFDLQPVAATEFVGDATDELSEASAVSEEQVESTEESLSNEPEIDTASLEDISLDASDAEPVEEDSATNSSVHNPQELSQDNPAQIDEEQLKQALQEAYDQGFAVARQELLEVERQLEQRYSLLWEDMQTQLDETLRVNEVRAVDLALQVAKRLVGDVVDNQRDYIFRVIKEAIKSAGGSTISAVRVSPQDFEFLKLDNYGDKSRFLNGEPLSFVSDESIRAGCILVTTAGEVDFDLARAWERMRAKVVQEPES